MTRYLLLAVLLLSAAAIGLTPVAAETSVVAAETSADPPSTFLPLFETGAEWGEDEYTTSIAFGDIDADGRDEIAIARHATTGARVFLLDDAEADFAPLAVFGEGWGVAAWPTSVAFGNVDDDPALELAVARVTNVNERVQIYDDAAADFAVLHNIGKEWDAAIYAVAVAFGDVDGDGRDELGLLSSADSGERVFIHDDAPAGFAPLWTAGDDWGVLATATSLAFGDPDGDGVDEIAFTRNHTINARFYVYDGAPDFGLLWSGGETWGAGSYATGVAFGNVDDDPADEMGITRFASLNERAYIFDDASAGFAQLQKFGETWAGNAWATGIAFGDSDADGRDEIAIARVATVNPRVFVHDDAAPGDSRQSWGLIWGGGEAWPGPDYATAVAFGDVNNIPEAELAFGRFAAEGSRAFVLLRGWSTALPFVSNEPPVEEEQGAPVVP